MSECWLEIALDKNRIGSKLLNSTNRFGCATVGDCALFFGNASIYRVGTLGRVREMVNMSLAAIGLGR